MIKDNQLHLILLIAVIAVFIWSAVNPTDRFTWFLEVIWVIVAVPLLLILYPKVKLTNLLYSLIAVHAIILIIGGRYTYAEMPLFNWIRDTFDLSRNHYDRVGHFAQGFIPAILAREILIRNKVMSRGGWMFYVVVSICLAFSAFFEFIEWWVALASGSKADAFLAVQGDIWDTQWDMFLAMCGSIIAQLSLSRLHDRQLARFGL